MAKHILILTGSPRRNGNSNRLAKALAEGAREAGHTVQVQDVGRAQLRGCLACERCWQGTDKPCVQQDDMQALFPVLEQADVVVLASPLYFFGLSAQLKAAIDRLYPYYGDASPVDLRGKECALLLTAASDDPADWVGVLETYNILTGYLKWQDRGQIVADGVSAVGDIEGHEALQRARALGRGL
jgi:multimeric flavodoxin WrbA